MKPNLTVFGRNEGAPYHPLDAILPALVSLFDTQFEVRTTDRAEELLGLEGVSVLVALDDSWTEPLERIRLDAVEAWVRAGGRLILVHNGICWARDNRWRRLAGARFVGHGPAKVLRFTHYRTGSHFDLFEEPYRFEVPLLSGNRVLGVYEDEGRTWPAFWTRRVGKGTVAYALPGHGLEAFQHPEYRHWLLNLALN